jgi:hypothetical protein
VGLDRHADDAALKVDQNESGAVRIEGRKHAASLAAKASRANAPVQEE